MRKSRLSAAIWVASILAVAGCQGGSPSDMGASTETSADSSSEATSQEGNGSLFSFELARVWVLKVCPQSLLLTPTVGTYFWSPAWVKIAPIVPTTGFLSPPTPA